MKVSVVVSPAINDWKADPAEYRIPAPFVANLTVPDNPVPSTETIVFVSPASASVSFANTPSNTLLASSVTVSVSTLATGASFAPLTITVTVAVEMAPLPSCTV